MRVDAQKTPSMGSSEKATVCEYDPLLRSFWLGVQKGFEGWNSSQSERIWAIANADSGWPFFVDRPVMLVRLVCPIGIACRDRVVQEGGVITQDHLVQIKGSKFASRVQNTSEDGDLNIFQYFGAGIVICRRFWAGV